MSIDDDHGPAFRAGTVRKNIGSDDWSLRDWFAGQALAGMYAGTRGQYSAHDLAHLAQKAYRQADAMLDARKQESK